MLIVLQIILASFAGLLAGTITGLFPGIHINLVAALIFSVSAFLLQFLSPITLAAFIVAMSITHVFLDFIPSIFLGAPNEDTALSVLPGHRLLLQGLGYGAVKLTIMGCFSGLILSIAVAPLLILTVPSIFPFIQKYMAFILILSSLLLILKDDKKMGAIIIFAMSGVLGIVTLNFTLIKQPMLCLFSGLFGVSLLTISFLENVKLPKQKIASIKLSSKSKIVALATSLFSSLLVSFLPGVGSAQGAVIGSSFRKIKEETFLFLVGAINIIVMVWSFVALYAIQKPRSGSAVFVGKFLEYFSQNQLFMLLAVALFVGSFALVLCLLFSRIFAKNIEKIKYKWLCFGIGIFIIIIAAIISGPLSLLVLATGTMIGILCNELGVKKMQMMGSLLVPIIFYYLL